ncbi:MAG: hypothetical protein ACRD3S_17475 [Terracidiphilus sp.]
MEDELKKRGITVDAPWSLLFIPVLLLIGGISIPVAFVQRGIWKKRAKRLEVEMKRAGRLMAWPDFRKEMADGHGTAIEERHGFKGPVRHWWTPENLSDAYSGSISDWLEMIKNSDYDPFTFWCRHRYTDPKNGTAYLVDSKGVTNEEYMRYFPFEGIDHLLSRRIVCIVPPEALPKLRRQRWK